MTTNPPFWLPDLPYAYDALEPHIDAETLKVHHDGHHKAYVEKLNEALAKHPAYAKKSLEVLLTSLGEMEPDLRKAVRQNGGGHYNHTFQWAVLTPHAGTKRSAGLNEAIEKTFGSFEAFKKKFSKKAEKLFGSGYVWLCVDENGDLILKSLPDQDTPLLYGLKPIFLMDLWEHAYYLKHQNRRPEYIQSYWEVVNWEEVSKRWETAVEGRRTSQDRAA